jgi:crotonobetainyl-CoA:carnitine CoA-transferase CaiB-like acyl-CoA transferase
MRDLAEDPHLRAREWLAHSAAQRPGTYPGFPFRFLVAGGGRMTRPGPDLGQDNQDLLVHSLGLPASLVPPLDAAHLGTAFDLE